MGIFDFLFKPNIVKLKSQGDVDGLIDALTYRKHSRSNEVRKGAARALGEIRDARAVEPLVSALMDSDKSVRQEAIQALSEIEDRRTADAMIAALKNTDGIVRGIAARALGEMKDNRAIDPLFKALEDDAVRLYAALSLAALGDPRVENVLIGYLNGNNEYSKAFAAKALGKLKTGAAVEPLIKLIEANPFKLEAPSSGIMFKGVPFSVRAEAIRALGCIGGESAVAPLIRAFQENKEDISWKRKASTEFLLEALAKIKNEIVDVLTTKIDTGNFSGLWDVVMALDQIGKPQDPKEKAYRATITGDTDQLIEIGEPAVKPLIQALKHYKNHPDDAAYALGRIGHKNAVEPLIGALTRKDYLVKSAAVIALGNIGDKRAIEPLRKLSRNDKDHRIRSLSTDALLKLGGGDNVEPLIEALKDGDSDVRFKAALSLKENMCDQAIDHLIEALKDEDSRVREAAANALEKAGDKKAVHYIMEMLFENMSGNGASDCPEFYALFGGYKDIVFDIANPCECETNVINSRDWESHIQYTHIIRERHIRSLEQLCRIRTPISNNILHNAANMKDLRVVKEYIEMAGGERYGIISLQQSREKAVLELEKRGNPAYDQSAFLTDSYDV